MAELLKRYYPKHVDVHNYVAGNSIARKIDNWCTLNRKVLSKLDMRLGKEAINQLASSQPGIIEKVLADLRAKILKDCNADRESLYSGHEDSEGTYYLQLAIIDYLWILIDFSQFFLSLFIITCNNLTGSFRAQFRDGEVGAKSRWSGKQNCPPTRLCSPETGAAGEERHDLHAAAKDLAPGKHNEAERSEDRWSHGTDHEAADREKRHYSASSRYRQWNLETTYFYQVVPINLVEMPQLYIV